MDFQPWCCLISSLNNMSAPHGGLHWARARVWQSDGRSGNLAAATQIRMGSPPGGSSGGPRPGRSIGTDCNLRQGARHLKGTYKGDFFTYFFFRFVGPIWARPGPLKNGKSFCKKRTFFLSNTIFSKNRCF